MNNLEKDILRIAKESVSKAIETDLTKYDGPLNRLCNEVVHKYESDLKKIFDESFSSVIKTDQFKVAVRDAFNHKLAKILVSKLEGSVEKAVSMLRNDPTIKAQMILAIQKIVGEK